jgi:outer membrane protein TolC
MRRSELRASGGIALRIAAPLLAMLLASSAAAAGEDHLTLDEAVALADAHADVIVARAEEQVARAGIDVARARPEATFGFATHSITARESVALSVPLRWLGQRRLAVAAATASADAAAATVEERRAAARQEVRAAWFSLAAMQGRVAAVDARAKRVADASDAVKTLLDAGRVPRLDVVSAEAERLLAQSDALAARAELAAASEALASLLGRDPSATLVADGTSAPPPSDVPPKEPAAGAGPDSPAWRAEQARLLASDADVAAARAEGRPGLVLGAGADMGDPTQPGTDATMGLDVVVRFDGPARRALAVAERQREGAEAERLRRSLFAQLASARRREEAARFRLSALDEAALPASREAATLARVAHDEGRADLLQMLDSERRLTEVERERWDAWLDLALAASERAWLLGEDTP